MSKVSHGFTGQPGPPPTEMPESLAHDQAFSMIESAACSVRQQRVMLRFVHERLPESYAPVARHVAPALQELREAYRRLLMAEAELLKMEE